MNKSAFASELGRRLRLRLSRQMLAKYHERGMPLESIDCALAWLSQNSKGKPGRRAGKLGEANKGSGATSRPSGGASGATLQPADYCGALEPDPFLTPEDGPNFYHPELASADLVKLSQLLQDRVPKLTHVTPALAAVVRRAIRQVVCSWSGGEACPHCRRAVGIVEPPEPDDKPAVRPASS